MSLSKETVQQLFTHHVGRPIEPELAEAVAQVVGPLIEALNAIEPKPIFLVEPSTVFEPRYASERSEWYDLL